MGRTRRKFSPKEKLKMVMAVIQDGKAVSEVVEENSVHLKQNSKRRMRSLPRLPRKT